LKRVVDAAVKAKAISKEDAQAFKVMVGKLSGTASDYEIFEKLGKMGYEVPGKGDTGGK
jgi:hypothetical protein